MNREAIAKSLSRLIANRSQNEVACGKLLQYAEGASVLLPRTAQMVFVDAQLRTAPGNVDLLVCADEPIASGGTARRVFVWELKAPQRSLFRLKTHTRAEPTPELYSAENQLLHYYAFLKGSAADRKMFGVSSDDDVRLGGIVIGTTATFVKRKRGVAPDRAKRLAQSAMEHREQTFYRHPNITLMTWDTVLTNLNVITASHRQFIKGRRTARFR